MEFFGRENGSFFERGGKPLYVAKPSQDGAEIVTGISLKRGDKLVNGSGLITVFYFKIKQTGTKESSYGLAFKNTVAASIKNGVRKNLNSIKWTPCGL